MTEALEQEPDVELIAAVRDGDVSAFGVLYERHLPAAKRAAACLARTPAEREDLVAEAFTRVLRALREGRGPDEEFRPYLLVTLRNAAINGATRGVPVALYADVPDVCPIEAVDEPVIQRWQATVAADAFASLPERWRMVLWHTEVEDESPAHVAPLLGMRPNSVAALAYRAREGLRRAYLRMHVPEPSHRECRSTVDKLAGYVRGGIPLPLSHRINRHLSRCSDCRCRAVTLTKVNAELRGVIGPAVLGAPLAAAYLPAASGAASGAAPGAVTSGVAAVASEATASGMVAVKAAVVQVAAALTVASAGVTAGVTAEATATSSAPEPAGPSLPAGDMRPPAVAQSTDTPGTPTSPGTSGSPATPDSPLFPGSPNSAATPSSPGSPASDRAAAGGLDRATAASDRAASASDRAASASDHAASASNRAAAARGSDRAAARGFDPARANEADRTTANEAVDAAGTTAETTAESSARPARDEPGRIERDTSRAHAPEIAGPARDTTGPGCATETPRRDRPAGRPLND